MPGTRRGSVGCDMACCVSRGPCRERRVRHSGCRGRTEPFVMGRSFLTAGEEAMIDLAKVLVPHVSVTNQESLHGLMRPGLVPCF